MTNSSGEARSKKPQNRNARVWIGELKFRSGRKVNLGSDDVVLVVGPNNSGKSELLRSIRNLIENGTAKGPLISGISLAKQGSADELQSWLQQFLIPHTRILDNPVYRHFGQEVREQDALSWWTGDSLYGLAPFFAFLMSGENRIAFSNTQSGVDYPQDGPRHPAHVLARFPELEEKLSKQFRRAFGVDLVVHRGAGSTVPLLVGDRPTPGRGEDRISTTFIQRLETLPRLMVQGDGMRSFASILLATAAGTESVFLVDEPEAFLHPPQARFLGRMLVADKQLDRQVFIATHSGDVVRGILDADPAAIRVLRLTRAKDGTGSVAVLGADRVRELWSDPQLRFSNVLDGLFHDVVVACEADGDSRFFAAVRDSIVDPENTDRRRPDVMFTSTGGKARLPIVVRALRELGVDVRAVADFDILNDEQPLRSIIEAAGGSWKDYERDWQEVKKAIESRKPDLSTEDVKKGIGEILAGVTEATFPKTAAEAVKKIVRHSSPWAIAKEAGKAYMPSGQSTQTLLRLLGNLRALGVFVIEVGELESFVRSIGNHGPAWVNRVLERDLKTDPELQDAREFVERLIS